jgi:Mg-chelatase subunit ChlD
MVKIVVIILAISIIAGAQDQEKKERPRIEVVFCLDTTGSMGPLIEGAKKKIWSIANEILKAKPTPEVKIGLVAYRDKGDVYVTKVFDLTDDLDKVYENLLSLRAAGGGDGPEHVNKALHDSVYSIKWSEDKKTFKVIYLVGDWPPHMDYDDGYDYRKICTEAVKKDIIINTIRCGNHAETQKIWQEIAKSSEGTYISIAQSGGMVSIKTPMDGELAKLHDKLGKTRLWYGKDKELSKKRELRFAGEAEELKAERCVLACAPGKLSMGDLVDAIRSKSVKLEDIKEEDLPDVLRKMKKEERIAHIEKLIKEREEIAKRIRELSEKRSAYIKEEMKRLSLKGDPFDVAVIKALRKQAEKKGIKFEEK